MELFSARMSVSVKPKESFINYCNAIMSGYLEKRKQSSDIERSAYDELADNVIKAIEDHSIYDIIAKSNSLYILPENSSAQPFNLDDFFRKDSQSLLNHEFTKWFGTEIIADLLLSETVENKGVFLKNFFTLVFYSFYLDLSKDKKDSLYVVISPGKEFKKWLVAIARPDMKVSLNLIKDTPSDMFDSFTSFVVKTNVVQHDDLDSFIQNNIDTILEYQRMAWIDNIEIFDDKLKWPSDMNMLTTFKKWFHINIYEDIYNL